jgi:hypothetical protein
MGENGHVTVAHLGDDLPHSFVRLALFCLCRNTKHDRFIRNSCNDCSPRADARLDVTQELDVSSVRLRTFSGNDTDGPSTHVPDGRNDETDK